MPPKHGPLIENQWGSPPSPAPAPPPVTPDPRLRDRRAVQPAPVPQPLPDLPQAQPEQRAQRDAMRPTRDAAPTPYQPQAPTSQGVADWARQQQASRPVSTNPQDGGFLGGHGPNGPAFGPGQPFPQGYTSPNRAFWQWSAWHYPSWEYTPPPPAPYGPGNPRPDARSGSAYGPGRPFDTEQANRPPYGPANPMQRAPAPPVLPDYTPQPQAFGYGERLLSQAQREQERARMTALATGYGQRDMPTPPPDGAFVNAPVEPGLSGQQGTAGPTRMNQMLYEWSAGRDSLQQAYLRGETSLPVGYTFEDGNRVWPDGWVRTPDGELVQSPGQQAADIGGPDHQLLSGQYGADTFGEWPNTSGSISGDAGFPAPDGAVSTGGAVPDPGGTVEEAVEAIAHDTPGTLPSTVPDGVSLPVEESRALADLLDKLAHGMRPGEIFELPMYLQRALAGEGPQFARYFGDLLRALGFTPMGDMGGLGFETDFYVPTWYQWSDDAAALLQQMPAGARQLMERLLKALLGDALREQRFGLPAVEEAKSDLVPPDLQPVEQPVEQPTSPVMPDAQGVA